MDVDIKVIDSLQALASCREDWNQILAENQNDNPFIEFEWVYRWLTFFLGDHELCCYVAEHEGKRVAFLPMIKKKTAFCSYIQFAGFGQANYMDIVALPAWKDQAIRRIVAELRQRRRTVIKLHGLLDSLGTAEALVGCSAEERTARTAASRHVPVYRRTFPFRRVSAYRPIPAYRSRTVAPYIDLNLDRAEFAGFIKQKMKRHGADRKEKRLAKLGQVAFAPLQAGRLEEMFRLHEKRWLGKMDTSGFTKGRTRDFYQSLVGLEGGAVAVQTRIDGLFMEGRLIAFFYGFVCRERYVLYALAHDDDFGVFSPGRLLLKEAVAAAYRSGLKNFDLSIGYEPYKLDWSTGLDQVSKVLFPGKGLTARLFFRRAALREELVSRLKRHRGLVHFKRHTLGRVKQLLFQLLHFDVSVIKSIMTRWRPFLDGHRIMEVYRADRERFDREIKEADFAAYRPVTMKELLQTPALYEGNREELIARLYHKQTGYYRLQEGQIENCFWVSGGGIPLAKRGEVLPLPEKTACIYDWKTFDTFESRTVAGIFAGNKELNSVYVALLPARQERRRLLEWGFVPDQRMEKRKFAGFGFGSQKIVQKSVQLKRE